MLAMMLNYLASAHTSLCNAQMENALHGTAPLPWLEFLASPVGCNATLRACTDDPF